MWGETMAEREAHAPERGVHLFRNVGPDRESKSLSERYTDRGSDLDHAILFRIAKRFPRKHGIIFFKDRAGRTMSGALTASHTG